MKIVLLVDKDELQFFEKSSLIYNRPYHLENCIIDLNHESVHFQETIKQINELSIPFLEIRYFNYESIFDIISNESLLVLKTSNVKEY